MEIVWKNLKVSEFYKICRLCLANKELEPLADEEKSTLVKLTPWIAQLETSVFFPNKICAECAKQLHQANEFVNRCNTLSNSFHECIEKYKDATKEDSRLPSLEALFVTTNVTIKHEIEQEPIIMPFTEVLLPQDIKKEILEFKDTVFIPQQTTSNQFLESAPDISENQIEKHNSKCLTPGLISSKATFLDNWTNEALNIVIQDNINTKLTNNETNGISNLINSSVNEAQIHIQDLNNIDDDCKIPPKKRRTDESFREGTALIDHPIENDSWIQRLLKSTVRGTVLLNMYSRNRKFSDQQRVELADILINHAMKEENKYKITTEKFHQLASSIQKQFPSELTSTYYIPYEYNKVLNKRVLAKGKLFDKYHNLRACLRQSDTLSKEKPAEMKAIKPFLLGHKERLFALDDDCNYDEKLLWLENHLEPKSTAEKYWHDTSKIRIKGLVESDISLVEYINKYKALRQPLGYNLIDIDFSVLYPQKTWSLFSEWGTFEKQVINYCKISKSSQEAVQKLIRLIPKINSSSESKHQTAVIVLRILPLILPVHMIKLQQKKYIRPSKAEVQNSFFMHVTSIAELKTQLDCRRNQLLGRGLREQPLAIAIGPSIDRIESYVVCIYDIQYNFNSPLEAIDCLFKSFYSLQIEFPTEAQLPWLVIQKRLYKITGEGDKVLPSILSFLKDLEQ